MKRVKNPWIVLALCCGLAIASMGLSVNSSGVFYTPVCEALGLRRGDFSMHMTIFSLSTALFSLVVPFLLDKLPFKPLLGVSVVIAVLSTGLMACGRSIPVFYLLGAVRGVSTCVFSSLCLITVINHWFRTGSGLAVSVMFACTGVGGVAFSPLLSVCIASFGWQMGYVIMAALLLAFSLPAILVPFGLDPDEGKEQKKGESSTAPVPEPETKFKVFQPAFLALCVFGLLSGGMTSLSQYFPAHAQSLGVEATVGSVLLSCVMVGNIAAKLLLGVVSDRIGAVKAAWAALALYTAGLLCIIFSRVMGILSVGSVLYGVCFSVSSVGLALLTRKFFGLENYNKTYPIITLTINVGCAVALPVFGYIYDFSGSYQNAFFLALAMIGVSMACLVFCMLRTGKQAGKR